MGADDRLLKRAWLTPLLLTWTIACGASTPSSPSPSLARPSGPTTATCSNASVLETWSSMRLAEQAIAVPVDESDVRAVTPEVAAGAGGVLLFGSSAPSDLASQLQTVTAAAAPSGIQPLTMADEEGGAVQRMANLVGNVPSARAMGATMNAATIQQLAEGLGTRMRDAGMTMDLAPVLDLDGGDGPNNRDPDGTRSFSTDPVVASADGRAFADGLRAGGVVPVMKHFPGLGNATGNTDVTPAATLPWSQVEQSGLQPFRDAVAAHVPAVMVANASIPGLTSVPASVSPSVITGILRGQLGFHGLVLTDSLSATALTAAGYSVPQAAVAAIAAGADMVLFSADASHVASTTSATVDAIVAAVRDGALSRPRLVDAVSHVLAVKSVTLCN